jgi:hypothetical protein
LFGIASVKLSKIKKGGEMIYANRGFSGNVALSDEALRRNAPSIFATEPYHQCSNRYRFIPTIDVINGLRENGFSPVKAMQSRCRIPDKREFTKHMIRFRQQKDLENVEGQEIFEIVLINSHDRTSSYQLMLGIFRLVCSNGLIVGDTFSKIKTIHAGNRNLKQDVIDASYEIIENAPNVIETVNNWKGLLLPAPAQEAFAKSALELNPSSIEIEPKSLLRSRRLEDRPNEKGERNLWNTFNVIQENFIKGHVYGRNKKGNLRRTRAIKAVTADVKLNKALWRLTEEMQAILSK